MKKKTFLARVRWGALAMLATGGLLLTSCASDGFNEETFVGTGEGFELVSPDEGSITVKATSDKLYQTISWEAVRGAGTYTVTVRQGDSEGSYDNVIVDAQIVKVNYITIPRIDKTYYQISILTNDNVPEGNTGALTATEYEWSTFTLEMGTIPANSDIAQWFTENPIPAELVGSDITYRLVNGADYEMSDVVDLGNTMATIRPEKDDGDRPNIKFTGAHSGFVTLDGVTLRDINIDASSSDAAIVSMSKTPDENKKNSNNYYQIEESLVFQNLNVIGLKSRFIYDGGIQYSMKTVLIDNCLIELNTETENRFIAFNTGGIKDFIMTNSTVYQTNPTTNITYFIQYNNGANRKRLGYETENTSVTFKHNTFYKVGTSNWANYTGLQNNTDYVIENNIWVDCGGSGEIARRVLGNGRLNADCTASWARNTYWTNGAVKDQSQYDTSTDENAPLTTDPAYTDPENGNFTPTGAQQVQYKTGDLRWFEVLN